ncbi:hypothetical protein [Microlunatus flavus]|uniref:DUF1579 domain-containing protein n=1 Tax=Microlunatus flavus TaxID=1036181 RepID=A0A1H9L6E1_9ACTN|nr:hypothetical protein [Microlunatus flavus]SER06888.1 hypothetical protein SAMN05421756_108175 [Microlunatus flavus]
MPTSTADRLAFLLGSFTGVERMHPSVWASGGTAASTVKAVPEVGGELVVQRYTQWRDAAVSFELVVVWMVDPATDEVLYYGFDTAGFPADPPARGTWQPSGLVLERTTTRGSSRLTVRPTSTGWTWSRDFRRPDGQTWESVLDATFVAIPAEPAPGSGG